LVEASLLRLCGHGEHDDAAYIDARVKQSVVGRDCVTVATATAIERGWISEQGLAEWREACQARIDAAAGQVQREPAPDPYEHEWRALATAHLAEGVNETG
jgi:pyruvate dehydrogenase E1 component alpha subunit/2-oxoisovalerate dehydrogenase E1 component alpha subunit